MALVRALRFGVDSNGGGRQPGDVWDHKGPLGSWMEVVEQNAPPSSETQQPETQTETAPDAPVAEASGKRQLRNRKPKES